MGRQVPFMLYADKSIENVDEPFTFAPTFPPDRFSLNKDRNLESEEAMCDGEQVSDTGSKNRTIHVSGTLRGGSEVITFDNLLDWDKPIIVDTRGKAWEGRVRVANGSYEGPVGVDTQNPDLFHWDYSLDLKSTGKDEYDHFFNKGIISDGN